MNTQKKPPVSDVDLRTRLHQLRCELLHNPKPAPPEDCAFITTLICELPQRHARAVMRYYAIPGMSAENAIKGSGLSLDRFRELRASLRGRFFARTRRIAS